MKSKIWKTFYTKQDCSLHVNQPENLSLPEELSFLLKHYIKFLDTNEDEYYTFKDDCTTDYILKIF